MVSRLFRGELLEHQTVLIGYPIDKLKGNPHEVVSTGGGVLALRITMPRN
jgi:hypothetical protein